MATKTHYSKITVSQNNPFVTTWNNITLSPKTQQERARIKWGIDDFASFSWRGVDAFETFGAFIINNKNSLKFYNGPTFTNEYTKPQFETAAGQLTGVTFAIQKIDFMIGVYWISEEDYRQMIYWLHPYVIDTLTFGFEPNYYYQVKLAAIDNGNRYIVGNEMVNNKVEPRYYTELKLTFEIQGPAVAYYNTEYEWLEPEIQIEDIPANEYRGIQRFDTSGVTLKSSDLETPMIIYTSIDLSKIPALSNNLLFSAYVYYESHTDEKKKLFEVEFKNLTYFTAEDDTSNILNVVYDSEKALLFLQHGDSMQELLTRLTTLSSGDRLIDHLTVNQFRIPGVFDDVSFDINKIYLEYQLKILDPVGQTTTITRTGLFDATISCRPRTNLI